MWERWEDARVLRDRDRWVDSDMRRAEWRLLAKQYLWVAAVLTAGAVAAGVWFL